MIQISNDIRRRQIQGYLFQVCESTLVPTLGGGAGAALALRRLALRRFRRCFPGAPVSAAYVGVSAGVSFGGGAGGDGVTTTCLTFLCVTTVQSLSVSVVFAGASTLGSGAGTGGVGRDILRLLRPQTRAKTRTRQNSTVIRMS